MVISNHRLLSGEDGQISFSYKDYSSADPQRERVMTLKADEFIRRFLLHAVPAGYQRIRHYGLYANRNRESNLALSRKLLDVTCLDLLPSAAQTRQVLKEIVEAAATCPRCKVGKMLRVMKLPCIPWPERPP